LIIKKTILDLYLPTAESVVLEKKRIAYVLFEYRCFGCRKSYGDGKNFAYHHQDYDKDRKTSKDFKNTIEYNRYVLGEVITFPKRFVLFCKSCHNRMDNFKTGMSLVSKDTLTRLYMVALLSEPKLRKTRDKGGESKPVSPSNPECLENMGKGLK